ncbi:MAG: monovalent cation/H+ antiporter complex subunit F [Elusimicrobiota bacterium]
MLNIALLILVVACFLCLWRFVKGPNGSDRFLSIILLTHIAMGFLGIYAVKTQSEFLIDLTIDTVILAFIGTLAVSKYLQGKELDE